METEQLITNVPFDELKIGQSASLTKTLSPDDIKLFAVMSGDINPAHLDKQYAGDHQFGGIIGHGMWSGAIISTVLGTILPGIGTIYLNQALEFKRPIHPNETVVFTVTVKEKKLNKPIVVFECVCVNSLGEVVVSGNATVLAPTEKISVKRPHLPEIFMHEYDFYQQLIDSCKGFPPVPTAIVHPTDALTLKAALEATEFGLITPILIGPEDKIKKAADEAGIDISKYTLLNTEHSHASAEMAVELAVSKKVQIIQKGKLHTDELLGAVVKSKGLHTERRISHCYFMDVPTYSKPLIITDAAINISPTLNEKADICRNAIDLWHIVNTIDGRLPKVAVLAAVETVTDRMQATIDAASLCKMADRDQIKRAILDGPLAFDLAISKQAVESKGIKSLVAGDADILLMPDINAGNMVAKQLTFLTLSDAAGVVLGARVPIVITSRSDSVKTRLMSTALAIRISDARSKGAIK
ncbi:MAG: bifunctional enoyl-CoA hydratase/phosphate acetyltransferase [Rickettsiales bacterium]